MDYFHGKRYLDTLPDWERGHPHPGPLEDYLPRMRALLSRLGHPERDFRSLIVGGTNGKGTASSLAAALLGAAGYRVGLYTSPHLHSQRERIRVDGAIFTKDRWAEALTELYDRTREFAGEGFGEYTRFEALTALAALLFAQEGLAIAVFEVGLGGRYDATNAWDSEAAALTAIGLDHVETLGRRVETIAEDKLHIARPGCPLFTTAAQVPEVRALLRRRCGERGIDLYECGPDGVTAIGAAEGGPRPYPCEPDALAGRPRTYGENARVALALAAWAAGGRLGPRVAETVRAHRWPGRFERAREQPLVILDGAHNPPAAAALAEDLRPLARRWTFVVGASSGHDAGGLMAALAPLARRFVLTASEHPRAVDPEALRALVPAAVPAEVRRPCGQAVGHAVATAAGEGICVTGSLHVVAHARDHLGLPVERDGITEDVALESLACLETACRRLGMTYAPASANGQVVRVSAGARSVYFLRNKHPFNDYVAGRLAEDKGYQHELFAGAGVPVPLTLEVFNPYADERFNRYKTHGSVEAVAADVERRMAYPVVVKKYRSSLAQGVYLEADADSLRRRLQGLFENSGYLDNTLLVQAYVAGPEYRIVATRGELLLAYEKESQGRDGAAADLNPLHQSTGRAVRVRDDGLLARLRDLTRQVAAVLELGFYAIDLIDGPRGLVVLELNPNPFCFYYNRSHGRDDFVAIYQRLLRQHLRP